MSLSSPCLNVNLARRWAYLPGVKFPEPVQKIIDTTDSSTDEDSTLKRQGSHTVSPSVQRARVWASVPGVVFPHAMMKLLSDDRCVTVRPSDKEWIAAARLAKHLGIGSERANAVGMRADNDYVVYVDPSNPTVRTRYFHRDKVMDLTVQEAFPAKDYEGTHMGVKKVMSTLGISHNAVARLVQRGKLHPVRVKGGPVRGIHYVYPNKEVEKIKDARD